MDVTQGNARDKMNFQQLIRVFVEFDSSLWNERAMRRFDPNNNSERIKIGKIRDSIASGFSIDCQRCWLLSEKQLYLYSISSGRKTEAEMWASFPAEETERFTAAAMGNSAVAIISSRGCKVLHLTDDVPAHTLSPFYREGHIDSVAMYEDSRYILVALAYHVELEIHVTLYSMRDWEEGFTGGTKGTQIEGTDANPFDRCKWLQFSRDGKFLACVTKQSLFAVLKISRKANELVTVCTGRKNFAAVSYYSYSAKKERKKERNCIVGRGKLIYC